MTRTPKALVRELVEAYNAKALDRLLDLYRPDARFWDPFHREGLTGREAIGDAIRDLFERLPDEQMAIETLAADETYAVAEFRSTGTAPSGRPYQLEFTEVYEVTNGQIASCHVYIDTEQIPA